MVRIVKLAEHAVVDEQLAVAMIGRSEGGDVLLACYAVMLEGEGIAAYDLRHLAQLRCAAVGYDVLSVAQCAPMVYDIVAEGMCGEIG